MPENTTNWSVYVLRCGDGSLYTGIATDVERRLGQHRNGPGGAKYLRGRGPLKLLVSRAVGSRGLASRVEYRLKQLDRLQKLEVCRSGKHFDDFLDELLRELAAA